MIVSSVILKELGMSRIAYQALQKNTPQPYGLLTLKANSPWAVQNTLFKHLIVFAFCAAVNNMPAGKLPTSLTLGAALKAEINGTPKFNKTQWNGILLDMVELTNKLRLARLAHNDLHRGNILLSVCDQDVRVLFIDFGTAQYRETNVRVYDEDVFNTQDHIAPELCVCQILSTSDLWSVMTSIRMAGSVFNNKDLREFCHQYTFLTDPYKRPKHSYVSAQLRKILNV